MCGDVDEDAGELEEQRYKDGRRGCEIAHLPQPVEEMQAV